MAEIAAIGIAGAVLAVMLHKEKPEMSLVLALAVAVLIFAGSFTKLSTVLEGIRQIEGYFSLDSVYLKLMLKILGITYLSEFASGICKDAGQGSIGDQIRIFARLSILSVSMPVVLGLLETIQSMLTGGG